MREDCITEVVNSLSGLYRSRITGSFTESSSDSFHSTAERPGKLDLLSLLLNYTTLSAQYGISRKQIHLFRLMVKHTSLIR
jgi:hypothetical protein